MGPEVCILRILSEIRLINIAVTKGYTFTETGITFICNHSNFSVVCVNATLLLITCHYLFQVICIRV